MEIGSLFAFATLAVALILVPGPDWAYILATGARERFVIPPVAGIVLGYVVITAVVTAGLGPIVAAAPLALDLLTVGGGAYIVFLGVRTLRSTATGIEVEGIPVAGPGSVVIRGMGVSALNPKALLLFVAILPQFTRAEAAWPLAAQLMSLGAVYIAMCTVVYLALGFSARRISQARPGAGRLTTRLAGAAMIVMGVALLAERVVHAVS
ncbi:LysE family translocator [Microbacterium sp. ABRD28]|uniref:LysE family translocator n=1 Tax=Microbacterium sp. ABRD28 TaxID=2268461 RepID=UPI000F54E249|nr:LysE family translocator [Microbacterium sp. ABRD28]AZC13209.1 LysE family translocator [Microbacterium sp. ABRD28]